MTPTLFLEKIKKLEREIQFLKIESVFRLRKIIEESSIVKKTCGILGEKFIKGIKFENSLRKDWEKRFRELKI